MASGGAEESSAVENRTPRPIAERFRIAVAMIRTLPKEGPYMADNKTKLRFYALYKQATEGPCHAPKPGFWDVVGKAKWEAWNVCGNMNKEIAMQLYVEELTEMVKKLPVTREVTNFLESISPFLPETGKVGGEEGEGEEGEEVKLTSSVLHRVDELELSRGERDEEEGKEGEEGEGREEGEKGKEGEGEEGEGSVSSNEDYQESFQDPQGANGELLSPWQHVSSDSLSPSFEVLVSDSPHNKTPELQSTPEAPLPHPSVTPPSQNQVDGVSSDFTSRLRRNDGSRWEGVNDRRRRGGGGEWGVVREVRLVREKVEEALHQIQNLSRQIQNLVQQQTGHGDTGVAGSARVARRQRRLRRVVHLSLVLIGWPLLIHLLISYLFKRTGVTLPLWVWNAISAAHVILSFLLRHRGFPL